MHKLIAAIASRFRPVPLPADLEGLANVEHIDAPGRGPAPNHQWRTLFHTEHGYGWYASDRPSAAGLGKLQLVRYRLDHGDAGRVRIVALTAPSAPG